MLENAPTRWNVRCPECAAAVTIELPPDAEPGTGIQRCDGGHDFLFRYDGWSPGALTSLARRT